MSQRKYGLPLSVSYWIKRFRYLIGLPDEIDFDSYAAKKITLMEESARSLLITRRGYNHSDPNWEFPEFKWKNSIGRIIFIIVLIRMTILSFYPNSTNCLWINIYLGNPFHGETYSSTVAILGLSLLVVCGALREYCIYLDDIGAIKDLEFLRVIQLHGFDCERLLINRKQISSFKRFLVFHVTNWTSMLRFNKLANGLIMLSFRLYDPLFYSNPVYAIISIIWIIMETIASRLSFTSLLNVGGTGIALVPWYLARLRSCYDLALKVSLQNSVNESSLKRVNYRVIRFLNGLDKIMDDSKYLLFVAIFLTSFLADSVIFLAIVSKFPKQIIGTFYFAGFFCITAIGFIIYFTGGFVQLADEIYILLVKIVNKCPLAIEEKLNTHKILDRIGIFGTGTKIGDIIDRVTRDLFVYYILENASTVMLLICNINASI
ncbi:uncharacterized protein LOC128396062 [Panonychus citri]|uniref:uncharacterized protein LOC128396062 n=1 Tax=Panonychus citri TaxID=50023 RepID=UPI002307C7F5|nr:uncharacterized protein LOC128396062 [Panonychus citri]